MKYRRWLLFLALLLVVQFLSGCSVFDRKNEELPENREVKHVIFPVKHFEYSEIECIQEYENVSVSGILTNVSPYTLTNVGVDVKILFAGDADPNMFTLPAIPSAVFPDETATFSIDVIVEDPAAIIELHAVWEQDEEE